VLLAVGGTADHVHLLVRLKPDMSVSKIVQLMKANSSKWIHRQLLGHRYVITRSNQTVLVPFLVVHPPKFGDVKLERCIPKSPIQVVQHGQDHGIRVVPLAPIGKGLGTAEWGQSSPAGFASLDLAVAWAKKGPLESIHTLIDGVVESFPAGVDQAGVLRALALVEVMLFAGRQGDVEEAAATAAEMLRRYRRNPHLVFEAMARRPAAASPLETADPAIQLDRLF
jgi:transposase IS200 family protein